MSEGAEVVRICNIKRRREIKVRLARKNQSRNHFDPSTFLVLERERCTVPALSSCNMCYGSDLIEPSFFHNAKRRQWHYESSSRFQVGGVLFYDGVGEVPSENDDVVGHLCIDS